MHKLGTQKLALGVGGLGLALVMAVLAFITLHSGGHAPVAQAAGSPTAGNISGVSCADVWLGLGIDYLHAAATPFPWTVGDPPPIGASSDVAISLSRTTHDSAIASPTPNITDAVSVTYNAGIAGIIAGAINGAAPQCAKVDKQLDTVTSVTTEGLSPKVVVSGTGQTIDNGEFVYWNADPTVATRKGFYKVTNVSGTTIDLKRTDAKCSSTPADAGDQFGGLWRCVPANTPLKVFGYESLDVTNNALNGDPPRSTTGSYDAGTGLLTYTTCSASDAPAEASYQNAWTRTTVTVKVNTTAAANTSVPSYGISQLFNPTDPKTCADNVNTLRTTVFLVTWSLDSAAREGPTSKWNSDYDGDGCPDWQELNNPPMTLGSSPTFTGGRDPFNPLDCKHSPPALEGIWGIDVSAAPVTLDGGNNVLPGAFYRCRAAVLQSGNSLSPVPIYCYTDAVLAGSPVAVNPAAVGNQTFCAPGGTAPAGTCGDGLGGVTYPAGAAGNPPHDWPGPAGPGCTVGVINLTSCPEGVSGGGPSSACDDRLDNDFGQGTATGATTGPPGTLTDTTAPFTGTATGAVTGPPGTMTDTGATWVANGLVGWTVTAGGQTLTVASNSATMITGTAGWSGGGNPGPVAYTINWPVNGLVGMTVTAGGKTLIVASNTATAITGGADISHPLGGWSGGGNPGAVAYSIGDGTINDGCPSKLYGQVDPAHNIISGAYNDTADRISFEGCYANVAGAQGPNVYIKTLNVDPTTGHGTAEIWLAQATCAPPGGAATYPAANIQMVHLGLVGTILSGTATGAATGPPGTLTDAAATWTVNGVVRDLTGDIVTAAGGKTLTITSQTTGLTLTGTVAKNSGSAILTGTGTLFTSQLAVGNDISVPGVANETKTIMSITNDTSLTVDSNFANTASGQTATRLPKLYGTGGWSGGGNPGAVAYTIYVNGYDGDLDGCADYMIDADQVTAGNQVGGELGTIRTLGGVRDPFNRWDYPDAPIPFNVRKIRVDDVSFVVNRYRHDRGQTPAPPNPYDAHADHVTILGSNVWNLGPGNGQIRVDDVSQVVNQYRNDCGP